MAHVSESKRKEVAEFVELCKEYPVVGVVNMMGLPTPQVQSMRAKLRGSVVIRMTKKTLTRIILKEVESLKPGITQLGDRLKGMSAFIFTKDNPFVLFKTLKKNKSKAPARPGQQAPNDIVVPAGPTPFAPGPVIGELGQVGIKAGIDAGKVIIKQDSIVAKEGDTISAQLAGLLERLDIRPMEIGLDLVAVYEKGSIFDKTVLDVDEHQFIADVQQAHRWSFNVAMDVGIFTQETSELLFTKAQREAMALAISQAIESKQVIEQLVGNAHRHAQSIQGIIEL